MISGLLTLILLTAPPPEDRADGLEALLTALQPEAEAPTLQFTETRESPLTEQPLTVTGKFWRDDDDRLVRQTLEPQRATQRLGERLVVIERPNRSTRRFSLSRAPELAVLRHALVAILAGDATALRRHFEHELEEADSGWRLLLTPRDEGLAAKVESLSLSGPPGELRRFVLSLADGEVITTEIEPLP